jgi:hypothetical protein
MTSRSPDAGGRATLVLILAFLCLLPAVTVRLNASDEIEYFAWLRSWVFDRDVDFENEYRYFHDLAPEKHGGLRQTFLEGVNEAGRRPNFAPVGTAILWSPFYAAGHLAAAVTGAPADGFSRPYLVAVTYASALFGLLALLFSAAVARSLIRAPATAAIWVVWFGTPLLFYMYVAPGFSHAASAMSVSLFLWLWLKVRDRWTLRGTAALGAVAGLLPMVREQDAFFVIGPALDFARFAWQTRQIGRSTTVTRPSLVALALSGAVGLLTAIVVVAPQFFAYNALNGHFGPTAPVARTMSWSSPHFAGVVLSPEHGLFFWTPLAALAIAGLCWWTFSRASAAAVEARWLGRLFLLLVVLQIYVSGAVESWTVAGSFGQRRFVALTPILVVGLTALLAAVRPHRRWRLGVLSALALGIWWNVGLMAQFGLHLMDRQRMELGRNATVTFLELPRLAPAIAWRYLTDRESLFDLPRRE